MNGSIRVRMRMQFRASLSGASSGSGKEGWFLRTKRREHTASKRVSRFVNAVSRVRRMSAGVNILKTSSVDSGSSQNFYSQRSQRDNKPPTSAIFEEERNNTHFGPERIVSRYVLILRQAEDALLEDKLRLRGSHIGSSKLITRPSSFS